MVKILFLTFLATLVNADPQLIALNRFSSIAPFDINGVEAGARLYLASADDNSVLKNILITTGANSITLDKLNDYNDDGTLKSIILVGNLQITTSNNDTTMATVTGNLYITTKTQADDPNFSVYVIKDQHYISTNAMKSTVVVLNTGLSNSVEADAPSKTSYVSGMNQSPNTNIYFQWGIPASNWYEVTNNTFFRNPVDFTNEGGMRTFFDNVEPLQINLDAWYFQVMGPNNIKIEKKYISNKNYTVIAAKTTGLIMNSGIYQEHVVNFTPDMTKTGVSGIFYAAFGEYGTIGVYLKSATAGVSSVTNDTNNSKDEWSFFTNDQAYQLTVNTTLDKPGTFFAQYFTVPGEDKPVTNPPVTVLPTTTLVPTEAGGVSTTTVGTSTKGSGCVFGWLIMVMMGVRLL